MTAQRWIGFALVALQAALVGFLSQDLLIPILAGALTLVGMVRPLRLHWALERRVIAALILAVVVAIKWRLMPDVPRDNLIMNRGLGMGLAHYVLLLQASLFHLEFPARKYPLALPKTLPAYAAAVLACAGDVTARGLEISVYQAAAFAFLVLSVLYISVSDGHALFLRRFPARAVTSAVLLLVVSGIAWSSAWFMGEYRGKIDEILLAPFASSFAPGQSVGFSGSARLGNIAHVKSTSEDKAALRVFAASEPGYMRGRAFLSFDGQEWEPDPADREAVPDATLPAEPRRPHELPANAFRLEPGSAPWNVYEVWTGEDFPVAFTPLGTGILAASADRLQVSDSGLAEGQALGQYAAYVPQTMPTPGELSGARRDRYTALPDNLDPGVRALAAELFRQCGSVSGKIDAVERYFHTEYQYVLGIQIPPGQDPMTYFLLKKPAAHCEYFASGAVLLLRLGGVPCRYMTGFVASERNGSGGYWVARNRDAHAWAEAFDDTRGWRTVEATPSAGVPQSRAASNEWLDNLRFRWRELLTMGFGGALRLFLAGLLRYAIPIGVVSAVVAMLWVLWHRLRTQGLSGIAWRKRQNDAMLTLLTRMDVLAAGRGYRRGKAETLHRFADRLDGSEDEFLLKSVANWYRSYAEARYRGPVNPISFEHLQQTCSEILELSRKIPRSNAD